MFETSLTPAVVALSSLIMVVLRKRKPYRGAAINFFLSISDILLQLFVGIWVNELLKSQWNFTKWAGSYYVGFRLVLLVLTVGYWADV